MTGHTRRWATTTLSIAASLFLVVALIAPLPTRWPAFGQLATAGPTDIVIPTAWENDAAIALATGDLQAAVSEQFGNAPRIVADDSPALRPNAVVLLGPGSALLEQLIRGGALQPETLSDDGYRLLRTHYRGQPVTFIIGGGFRGVAYGAFRLVELMRLDPDVMRRPLDLRAEPAIALRLVSSPTGDNYPTPEQALRWGFNTVQVTQWPWLITYEGYDPAILGAPDSEDRQWVQANRRRAAEDIARAKALHLQVLAWGDAVSLPRNTIDLYGAEVGLRGADRQPIFCLSRPRTQALYTYSLRELLSAFPGIDIVMIRTGENYPTGPIVGNTPDKRECGGDNGDPIKMVRLTMDLSYKQIVEWGGRRYIQRAWDIGHEGFHADPDVAGAVLAGWGGKPGLIVSFKHTKTDFWRYNPPNPNLAKQRLSRMVEYQSAREYEGKGAFPNYIGGIVAHGAKEVAGDGSIVRVVNEGVDAIWVWARGGGWNGPFVKNDLWVDANNYALSRLMWDPQLSARALAMQWATLRFGAKAAPYVARALELSDEQVLRAFYVAPFARFQGPWAPNIAWTRDDVIFGADRVGALYQQSKAESAFAEAVSEKALAMQLAREVAANLQRAAELTSDPVLAAFTVNSARYGEALTDTFGNYVIGMFYYFRWLDGGRTNQADRAASIGYLQAWAISWRAFNEVATLPDQASPFLDHGMVNAVTNALITLGAPVD